MVVIGDMRTFMASDNLNRNDLDGNIYYRAINHAVKFYSKYPFWFNSAYADITLLEGSDEIDFSSLPDFLHENESEGFNILCNDIRYALRKEKKINYDRLNIESSGIPYMYCWIDGHYKIYPKPDRDYILQVSYFKEYPDLTGYTDTNDFLTYAEDLIKDKALAEIWLTVEHEPEMASYHEQRANAELKRLQDLSRRKRATGKLYIKEGF